MNRGPPPGRAAGRSGAASTNGEHETNDGLAYLLAEEPGHHTRGRLAVIQRAEPLHERLIGARMRGGDVAGSRHRLDHVIGGGQQWAGRGRLEVEVEAAQVVAVL